MLRRREPVHTAAMHGPCEVEVEEGERTRKVEREDVVKGETARRTASRSGNGRKRPRRRRSAADLVELRVLDRDRQRALDHVGELALVELRRVRDCRDPRRAARAERRQLGHLADVARLGVRPGGNRGGSAPTVVSCAHAHPTARRPALPPPCSWCGPCNSARGAAPTASSTSWPETWWWRRCATWTHRSSSAARERNGECGRSARTGWRGRERAGGRGLAKAGGGWVEVTVAGARGAPATRTATSGWR